MNIRNGKGGSDVVDISSLTTTSASPTSPPTSLPTPSEGSLGEETNLASTNVVHLDERIVALEATEKKRRLR